LLRSAFAQVAIGLCIGIPMAVFCGRYLAHQLYEVSRFNPLALAEAFITLSFCAVVASFLPARRAASIEPVKALRSE
jgi:ABC-type antimicrobial peptide transport system permease subunit